LKPARARQLVEYLRTSYRISIRRACGALRFDRSSYHYKHRRPEQASLRKRIRELSEARVRYGYRRIHVLLRREGWTINHKRTRRLYREEGLQLRRKTPKRKVSAKRREDRVAAIAANDCWSMDFLSDQLFDGRKIRVLTIVDNFTRVSPAIDVRLSYRGADVVASWNGSPRSTGGRSGSGWTTGRSSSRRTSTCGPGCMASSSTSRGRASQRTTPSRSRSTASSGWSV
jgi:transposase InsO family protein